VRFSSLCLFPYVKALSCTYERLIRTGSFHCRANGPKNLASSGERNSHFLFSAKVNANASFEINQHVKRKTLETTKEVTNMPNQNQVTYAPAPTGHMPWGRGTKNSGITPRLTVLLLGALWVGLAGSSNAQIPWYSGQRAFGQVTIEPAVDDATGNEIFLLTPNNVPLPSNSAQRAHAPLYLVLYPAASTIDANTLNCQPDNCDHAQTFAYPLKGHDHLVGVPHTGDFNVAWDVVLVAFTNQGFMDGAINNRILTLDQLNAALAAGDVTPIGPVTSFNCSITSAATYLRGTPLTFTVP